MEKILITAFEPFGIKGKILNRNESKVLARKIKNKYGFETLVLPVDNNCIKILIDKIESYKPSMLICLGESAGFRVESECYKNGVIIESNLAKQIKKKFGLWENKMGDYYCNDVYCEALLRIPRTIFIHVPFMIPTPLREIDRIIKYLFEIEEIQYENSIMR